jgi:hypothetical protein
VHADKSIHEQMRRAGAVDCVVKTGKLEELVKAIHAAVFA